MNSPTSLVANTAEEKRTQISNERAQRIARILELHGYSDDAQYLLTASACNSFDALTEANKKLREALETVNYELCALISPPFDGLTLIKWPDKPNWADKQALTLALKAARAALKSTGAK